MKGKVMKKTSDALADDQMPEINLKRARVAGVGEYFRRMAAEQRYVQLDTDLASQFPDAKSVNNSLREYLKLKEVLRGLFKLGGKARARKTA